MNKILNGTAILMLYAIISFGQTPKLTYDSLGSYVPPYLHYDTLCGEFLYENLVLPYVEGDAVVKNGGFINFGKKVNRNLYQKGIYFYFNSDFFYKKMREENPEIHYDSNAVYHSVYEMDSASIKDNTYRVETKINPAFGCYYKKYKIKMEVLYLGDVLQRVPKLSNGARGRKGDYEMVILPTFIITNIFDWEEKE